MRRVVRLLLVLGVAAGVLAGPVAVSSAGVTCGGAPVTILGTPEADEIEGTAGNDVILSLDGDDTIRAGGGDDIVCAGTGDDTVFGGSGADDLFGEDGNDILKGQDGDDRLLGQSGDDTLRGGFGNDTLKGGDGADTLRGQPGEDVARGQGGDDVIAGGHDSDRVLGGAGNDTVRGQRGDDMAKGQAGNDLVAGGHDNDRALGGGDDDTVRGQRGNDDVKGQNGNDFLAGGVGDDTLKGGRGDDILRGQAGVDRNKGGPGSDYCNEPSRIGCEPHLFQPFTVLGTGDTVVQFSIPGDVPAVIEATHNGSSNFVIWSLDDGFDEVDLLVNEIGAYEGNVAVNWWEFNDPVAHLEITADGDWTLRTYSMTAARPLQGDFISGAGDDVIRVDKTGGTRFAHDGDSNFVIWSLTGDGDADLVVNEIGEYDGVNNVESGTEYLLITADGHWTAEFQGTECDPSYPTVCILPPPPDLDCGDIEFTDFSVIGSDPHGFDTDNDGLGCET